MIRVLSFDADGTLVDRHFMDYFWNVGIPALYAEKNRIPLKDAKEKIIKMYHDVGENDIRWYMPEYWFSRLGLEESLEETLEKFKSEMRIYPEVPGVVKKLSKKYELIVVSNAPREILEFELSHMDDCFSHKFSSTSDFKQVRKNGDVYGRVLEKLKVDSRNILHVGDHWDFDYLAPREAGIKTVFLDRSGKRNGSDVIRNLAELESLL